MDPQKTNSVQATLAEMEEDPLELQEGEPTACRQPSSASMLQASIGECAHTHDFFDSEATHPLLPLDRLSREELAKGAVFCSKLATGKSAEGLVERGVRMRAVVPIGTILCVEYALYSQATAERAGCLRIRRTPSCEGGAAEWGGQKREEKQATPAKP